MSETPRCEVVPLPQQQVSFRIDGREITRWHFGSWATRPFFSPLVGPESGSSVTRIGHPGAPDHDHHRSVWFAHAKLLGMDFWSDQGETFIRQQQWLAYEDADEQAAMAVKLGWHDGHDPQPLLDQELIAVVRPLDRGEFTLDLHSKFVPRADQLEFQQTNYGLLAVRVAKSLSVHFGGGQITGASGSVGEANLFGKPSAWMDYSGSIAIADSIPRATVIEGITFFDHPENVSFPSKWHVREDGWMGASVCRDRAVVASQDNPLRLKYRLYIHRGGADVSRADEVFDQWAKEPDLHVVRSSEPHRRFQVEPV